MSSPQSYVLSSIHVSYCSFCILFRKCSLLVASGFCLNFESLKQNWSWLTQRWHHKVKYLTISCLQHYVLSSISSCSFCILFRKCSLMVASGFCLNLEWFSTSLKLACSSSLEKFKMNLRWNWRNWNNLLKSQVFTLLFHEFQSTLQNNFHINCNHYEGRCWI